MSKNTLDFVKGMSFYTEQTNSQFFKDLKRVLRKLGVSYIDKCCEDTFIGDAGASDLDQQILTINPNGTITISNGNTVDLCDAVKTCETQTSLGPVTFVNNVLSIPYTGENGTTQTRTVDLSSLAVDVSINNITYNPTTNSWVVTETDGSTFNITWNDILADADWCSAVKACETITTLTDNGDGTFTLINEAGVATTFSTSDTTTTLINNGDGTATYTNEIGVVTTFPIGPSTLIDNGDGTYTFTDSQSTSTIITPTVITTSPIIGNGTIANPIALNANNDLGVQGGFLQQGFPLVRRTQTNMTGFNREYFGDGVFSINNYPASVLSGAGKFVVQQLMTNLSPILRNIYSLKEFTHNGAPTAAADNILVQTRYTGNLPNSVTHRTLYSRLDLSGIAPDSTVVTQNVLIQGSGAPAVYNNVWNLRNSTYLTGTTSTNNMYSNYNENQYSNVVNGFSFYSKLENTSLNNQNYYSFYDATTPIGEASATNYWGLYLEPNRDNYIRGKTKIGNGANKATVGYYLEVGGNSLFAGNIDYTGTLNFTSDKKLKDITSDYNTDINNFKKIKTYNYTWKDIPLNDGLDKNESQIGVIADEIELLFPDFVSTKKRNVIVGYETVIEKEEITENEEVRYVDVEKQKPIVEEQEVKSVNYSKLTIAMLSTLQQLIKRVEHLENK